MKERKVYLDYLKAFSILLIILGHCLNYYHKNFTAFGQVGQVVLILIYAVHIPTFFTVAGFLCHRQPLNAYFRKKFFRVLLPFFVFSALKIVYNNLISGAFLHEAGGIGAQFVSAFVYGELFWFSYAVFLCYAVAPLFWQKEGDKPKAAIFGLIGLIVLDCLLWAFHIEVPNVFQIGNVLFYLPFFLTGYLMHCYEEKTRTLLQTYKVPLLLLCAVVLGGMFVLRYGFSVKSIGNIFPVAYLLAYALMYLLYLLCKALPQNSRVLITVSKYTYQLMLLDAFFKAILFAAFARWMTAGTALLIAVLDAALGVMVCKITEKIPGVKTLLGL